MLVWIVSPFMYSFRPFGERNKRRQIEVLPVVKMLSKIFGVYFGVESDCTLGMTFYHC